MLQRGLKSLSLISQWFGVEGVGTLFVFEVMLVLRMWFGIGTVAGHR